MDYQKNEIDGLGNIYYSQLLYLKEIRVHLELAVPVWHSGLTKKLSADIERVQRIAVNILISNTSYKEACSQLGLELLSERRQLLCQRFATNTSSTKSRHNELFQLEKTHAQDSRSGNIRYREHKTHTSRFYKSPLPYLTRLLNQ